MTRTRRLHRLALPSLVLLTGALAAGCGDDDKDGDLDDTGAQSLDEGGPYCEETATPLAAGEAGPTGVSADELLAAVPAHFEGELRFADDSVVSGVLDITVDPESVQHIASEAVYPEEGGADIGVICDDRVSVDAVVSLASADGRLMESLEMVLSTQAYEEGDAPGTAELLIQGWARLDPEALGGSLDLSALHDLSRYDEVEMGASLELVGGEAFGELSLQGEGTDGDVAFAENLPVASFELAARSPEETPDPVEGGEPGGGEPDEDGGSEPDPADD